MTKRERQLQDYVRENKAIELAAHGSDARKEAVVKMWDHVYPSLIEWCDWDDEPERSLRRVEDNLLSAFREIQMRDPKCFRKLRI